MSDLYDYALVVEQKASLESALDPCLIFLTYRNIYAGYQPGQGLFCPKIVVKGGVSADSRVIAHESLPSGNLASYNQLLQD